MLRNKDRLAVLSSPVIWRPATRQRIAPIASATTRILTRPRCTGNWEQRGAMLPMIRVKSLWRRRSRASELPCSGAVHSINMTGQKKEQLIQSSSRLAWQ